MLIRKPVDIPYSEVTPKDVYLNRRRFLVAGAAAIGAAGVGAEVAHSLSSPDSVQAAGKLNANQAGQYHNLLKDTANAKKDVTTWNNFYEFGSEKDDPSKNAPSWKPMEPWTIKIEGEVTQPKTVNVDDVMKLGLEERIYRFRCVEGWSIVVPWIGVPLNAVLKQVTPTSKAKYVAFETYYNAAEMPHSRGTGIRYPYVEGLRLDEANHPLTFLSVGMYGETMPNQDGAPIRLTVPWKYGFKNIKAIVRIRFQEAVPPTTWNLYKASWYGFYSNVNPNRDHPNWSQKDERRLGGGFLGQGTRIPTQIFNGYGAQVASLYSGMDLIKNF